MPSPTVSPRRVGTLGVAALTATMALVLSGCGGSTTSTATTSSTTPSAASTAASTAPPASASAAPAASASPAQAQPSAAVLPASVTDPLVADLKAAMSTYKVPGAVMAVCAPGYQDWVTAEGVSDLKANTPMTTDLEWGIRSITKSFTVTMILQLVDEGKLSLDDTIDTWVKGIPNGSTITLRELAAMSSGVPDYTTKAFIQDFVKDPTADFSIEQLIDYARAGKPMFPPGTKHVYANSSTLLLGAVVEKVTGTSFADALQERILGPLGLTSTHYPVTATGWSGPHPTGYQPSQDGTLEAQPDNFTVFGPAGAMTSKPGDLCTWAKALGSGALLSAQTQEERLVSAPLDTGPEYDTYGLGIGTLDGWVGHTGEGFGTTALAMYDPKTKTSAVILMNASGLGAHVPTKLFRTVSGPLAAIPAASS